MRMKLNPRAHSHRIRIYMCNNTAFDGAAPRWAWPGAAVGSDAVMYGEGLGDDLLRGPPPSETLVTLCNAHAPWHAIVDKLIEEYPDWEPHFAAAWDTHVEEGA